MRKAGAMLKAFRLGLPGLVVMVLGRLAATGRLPRNLFAGIRLPSTMRSDEAWRAGHEAAASALMIAGLGPVVTGIIVGIKNPGRKGQTVFSKISNLWLLGWIGFASVQANRAARATSADGGG